MVLRAALPQLCSLPTAQNDLFKTADDEWVLLNIDVMGYYQVNYDEDNWRKIQTQLQTNLSVGVCHHHPVPVPGLAQGHTLRSHTLFPLLGHPCHQSGSDHPRCLRPGQVSVPFLIRPRLALPGRAGDFSKSVSIVRISCPHCVPGTVQGLPVLTLSPPSAPRRLLVVPHHVPEEASE